MNITFNSKTHGKVTVVIKFYFNPQIRNGISLKIEKAKRNCTGLLINNFKPNLMRIESLTKKKTANKNADSKKQKRNYVWENYWEIKNYIYNFKFNQVIHLK